MPSKSNSQAIELIAEILGGENVISDAAQLHEAQTATFKTSQKILGILKPHSVEDISKIVKIVRQYKVSIYAISTGKNWGYGSRIPTKTNCFLLDLSRMNRILDYNEELGYVTVEPGVTQKQLYQFLRKRKSHFSLSTTGSSPDSSIIGNICERGVGLGPYGFRSHYISALEVVLASGQCIHTGFGRFSNAQATHVYPEGLGPSFADTFLQSNFGIVTKLTLLLVPTPLYSQLINWSIADDKALQLALKIIQEFNLFSTSKKATSFHNDLQMLSTKTQYPWNLTDDKTPLPTDVATQLMSKYEISYAWKGGVEIYGYTKQEVTAQVRYFRSLTKKMDGVDISPLYNSNTLNDQPKSIGNSIYWRMKTKPPRIKNPDIDGCGNIRISLAVPFTVKNINEVVETINEIITQFGYEPFIEIHCISERAVLVVTSLVFDRTINGEDAKALKCHDTLLDLLIKQGYYPYRLNIQAMSLIPKSTDAYDNFQKTIKGAIDPDNIFSPGRYEVRA